MGIINQRKTFRPLAAGAPEPMRELPVRLERMIHFVPPHNAKIMAPEKLEPMAAQVDVILFNFEDGIPAESKVAAREGAVKAMNSVDFGKTKTGVWVRVNDLASPWVADDIEKIVTQAGDKLDVIMIPKVERAEDILFVDRLVALYEARAGIKRPIMLHAILETAEGFNNVDEIAHASPRMHGISIGPADFAASLGMKTTRVGGGHPLYRMVADETTAGTPRATYPQDLWHLFMAKMNAACRAAGIKAFYGPFGDIKDPEACEQQFRNAAIQGIVGAWSLHPSQIDIAKRVFSADPDEVQMALKIMEALPYGNGTAMVDGKFQDSATWKQAKVIVDLALQTVEKDPEMGRVLFGPEGPKKNAAVIANARAFPALNI